MFYANDEFGKKIKPSSSGQMAFCGSCGESVVGKCGEIVPWYWSHVAGTDCDSWAEPITEWHAIWQDILEGEESANIEVPIERNGYMHRADAVLKGGTIIELQHSAISPAEIREREIFYGVQLIWIFDIQEAYEKERFEFKKERSPTKRTFRWKHPKMSIAFARRKVYLDLGNDWLLYLLKMYPDTPCGGIGELISRHDLFLNL